MDRGVAFMEMAMGKITPAPAMKTWRCSYVLNLYSRLRCVFSFTTQEIHARFWYKHPNLGTTSEILERNIVRGEISERNLVRGEISERNLVRGEISERNLVRGEILERNLVRGEILEKNLVRG